MEIMESILTRRSIRDYTNILVPEDLIIKIIKAGMYAPSAGNQRAWQFIVINDRNILDKIPEIHPYSQMLKKSNVAILVCGDKSLQKHQDFWAQDCSAATQNMLLAIHSLGLGGVWLGIYNIIERVEGIKKLLNLPEYITPFSLIPIGYPKDSVENTERFDKEKIHYNGW